MKPLLYVRVYGDPIPWKRHKTRMHGKFVQHYEQPVVADWKRTVQAQVLTVRPPAPFDVPLFVKVTFWLPRPKSAPKRVIYPTKRPDGGNLYKAVEDCLIGILWVDDSIIVDHHVRKRFNESPGVTLEVFELEA